MTKRPPDPSIFYPPDLGGKPVDEVAIVHCRQHRTFKVKTVASDEYEKSVQ